MPDLSEFNRLFDVLTERQTELDAVDPIATASIERRREAWARFMEAEDDLHAFMVEHFGPMDRTNMPDGWWDNLDV